MPLALTDWLAREIAQIGAVLGRDFSYALLRDVACPTLGDGASVPDDWAVETGSAKLSEAALGSALHVLVAADLVTKDGPTLHRTIASSMLLFRMQLMTAFSRAGG